MLPALSPALVATPDGLADEAMAPTCTRLWVGHRCTLPQGHDGDCVTVRRERQSGERMVTTPEGPGWKPSPVTPDDPRLATPDAGARPDHPGPTAVESTLAWLKREGLDGAPDGGALLACDSPSCPLRSPDAGAGLEALARGLQADIWKIARASIDREDLTSYLDRALALGVDASREAIQEVAHGAAEATARAEAAEGKLATLREVAGAYRAAVTSIRVTTPGVTEAGAALDAALEPTR